MQRASWMWHTLCSEGIWVGLRFLGTLKDELRVYLKRGPLVQLQLEVTWFLLFASQNSLP